MEPVAYEKEGLGSKLMGGRRKKSRKTKKSRKSRRKAQKSRRR